MTSVYVMVHLMGMRKISSQVMTYMELVPGVLVVASPCERFPNSSPNAWAHMVDMIGSTMSCSYFVMDSPVTG